MSFWKNASAPILFAGLALPVLMNCNGMPGIPGADCPAMKDGNFAALKFSGGAEVEGKLKGFLEAVYSLDKLALEMETSLIASCKELGTSIGMDEAKLTAEPKGGEGAKTVCGAVAGDIKAKLDAAGEVSLTLELGEPKCEADIDALVDCFGSCGAAIEPGEFEASCEGGEVSGTCEAECSGTCTVEAGAGCEGACGGTCKGECDGECSVKNEDGSCNGKCDGTCKGECTASCKMEGKAECSGSCSGGCSAEIKAPKCSGDFKPPSVSAECQTNCTAKTAASVKCTPPSLDIKVEGEASADIEALVAGLQVSLPKIVEIQIGMATRLVATGEALVQAGIDLPGVAAKAGLQAVGCIAIAAEMAIGASASVNVNVEASASVSGSAGG